MSVRRLVTLVLAQALVVSWTMATSLHVHEYVGHDHPDHHHGPASHEHQHSGSAEQDHHAPAEDEDHPAIQAESCDPGDMRSWPRWVVPRFRSRTSTSGSFQGQRACFRACPFDPSHLSLTYEFTVRPLTFESLHAPRL
jgi:hypothetical protein